MLLILLNFIRITVDSIYCTSDVSAVPAHPRSFILAPIESAYATSY